MLNFLDKVFEKIILKKLNEFTECNNIVYKEQLDFRKYHSIADRIRRIVNLITQNKPERKTTEIVC